VLERRSVSGAVSESYAVNVTATVGDHFRLVGGYDAVYAYLSSDGGTSWQSLGGYPIEFVDTEQMVGLAASGGSSTTFEDVALMRLPLFFELTQDDEDATLTGVWDSVSDAAAIMQGYRAASAAVGAATASFDLTPLLTGGWEVYVRSPSGVGQDTAVPMDVIHDDLALFPETDGIALDQSPPSQHHVWVRLGDFWLDRDTTGQQLVISNTNTTDDVAVDAIRLVKGAAAEPVIWMGQADGGVEASYDEGMAGSRLWKSSSIEGWDADAQGHLWIYQDGRVQFRFNRTDQDVFVGLAAGDVDAGVVGIDYAIYANGDAVAPQWEIRFNDADAIVMGAFSSSDVFAIERIEDDIRFLKNGVVEHVVSGAMTVPLLVDSSFYHGGTVEPLTSIDGVKIQNGISLLESVDAEGDLSLDVDQDGFPDD